MRVERAGFLIGTGRIGVWRGLDIADSPGTVADIRGLSAAWVGLATRARGRAQGAGALAGKRATGTSLGCPTVRARHGRGGDSLTDPWNGMMMRHACLLASAGQFRPVSVGDEA